MKLKPAIGATWHDGYRPTKCRITYTCDDYPTYRVAIRRNPGGPSYGAVDDYISMSEIPLECDDNIGALEFYRAHTNLHVQKIEFY